MTITQKKRKYDKSEISFDYGEKYHCDNCQKDISHLVRIKCAECKDFDLCVECFTQGIEVGTHLKSHAYRVFDILDFSLFSVDWSADEEMLLIDGLEVFGMGNWEGISGHIGTKTKKACLEHYLESYIQPDTYPLPDMTRVFSVRRSICTKEVDPKVDRAPASAPANHEVAGYMPGRREFEIEYDNDAEHLVKDMEFDEKDTEGDVRLKSAVLDIYNTALNRRVERKKFMLETDCLEFKKIQLQEKRRTQEERDIHKRVRVFAKMQTPEDYQSLATGLHNESKLRHRIAQLQEYKKMGITSFKEANEYDREKAQRSARNASSNELSKQPRHTSRQPRTSNIFGDDFVIDSYSKSNGTQAKDEVASRAASIKIAEGYDLLSQDEQGLCERLNIFPKAYFCIKETLLSEWQRRNGNMSKSEGRACLRIDVNKSSKIYDFFMAQGWFC